MQWQADENNERSMFYENVDFHVASLHTENRNNHAWNDQQTINENERYRRKHPEPQERLLLNVLLIGERKIGKSKLLEELRTNIFVRNRPASSLDLIYQRDEQSAEQRLHLKFQSIDLTSAWEHDLQADCLLFVYDTSKPRSLQHLTEPCSRFTRNDHLCSYFLIGIQHPFSPHRVTREQVRSFLHRCPLAHEEVRLTENHKDFLQSLLDHHFQRNSSKEGLLNQLERKIDSFRSWLFFWVRTSSAWSRSRAPVGCLKNACISGRISY